MNTYTVSMPLLWTMGGIFGFLSVVTIAFYFAARIKNTRLLEEMRIRTRSWWYITAGIAVVVLAPPVIGTVVLGYVSFVALREMFSISGFRAADRTALFLSYFAVPVQYYLAYHRHIEEFYYFIPLIMSIVLSFLMVLKGNTEKIGRSMAMIIAVILLTVYSPSHLTLLHNIEIPGFDSGTGGLILYVIVLTGLNDVFQFTWGKLLGRRKILPSVSPNKTWAGFIGGALSSAALGFALRYLTPFTPLEAAVTGLMMGVMGFVGDVVVSALKRDMKLKDTDDLIPGHGGAMDRLDSILVNAPIFYHLLNFFILH